MKNIERLRSEGLEIITHDVFEIVDLIKGIDDGYVIAYNKRLRRYELHHKNCNPTLQIVLPYEELDYRTYLHTLSTRVEKISAEIEEMDRYNERLGEKLMEKAVEEGKYIVKNMVSG